MADDPLIDLLRVADESSTAPRPAVDLAVRVRRLHRTRARRYRTIVVAISAICLVAASFIWRPIAERSPVGVANTDPPAVNSDVDVDRLKREIAELRSEADSLQRVAEHVHAIQAREATAAETARWNALPDPRIEIAYQAERAAYGMVFRGDRARDPADAREAYQRAAELFPESAAATLARRRMKL